MHERIVNKTKDKKRERGFCHVEMIMPNRQWFGVINGNKGNAGTVFLRHKLTYGEYGEYKRNINDIYPQVVQIRVTGEQEKLLMKFAKMRQVTGFYTKEMALAFLMLVFQQKQAVN